MHSTSKATIGILLNLIIKNRAVTTKKSSSYYAVKMRNYARQRKELTNLCALNSGALASTTTNFRSSAGAHEIFTSVSMMNSFFR